MKEYTTRAGLTQLKPSFEELRELDESGEGFCLACGNTQDAEPDAVRYECDACGARKVYGASELLLRNLFH